MMNRKLERVPCTASYEHCPNFFLVWPTLPGYLLCSQNLLQCRAFCRNLAPWIKPTAEIIALFQVFRQGNTPGCASCILTQVMTFEELFSYIRITDLLRNNDYSTAGVGRNSWQCLKYWETLQQQEPTFPTAKIFSCRRHVEKNFGNENRNPKIEY